MARLTVKDVEAKRATSDRREIADEYMRGLYLVVQPTGAKSWAVRYRHGGKSAKHTIGPYPAFGLKDARTAAGEVLRAVSEGRNPKQRQAGTVADAVEQFLERHGKHYRPRPLSEAKQRLQLYVVDEWGSRKLDGVTKADVRAMLDRIEKPVAANRVHSIVRKFFNWAVENDLIENSPVAGIKTPHPETSRDRVLTDNELKAVWRAAKHEAYPFGAILQLARPDGTAARGSRRHDVVRAGPRYRNVDAAEGADEEQAAARRAAIAPSGGNHQGAATHRRQVCFYAQRQNAVQRLQGQESVSTSWPRLHRGRYTTYAAPLPAAWRGLALALTVIEKILNHVSGSLAGIVAVYQRHEYAKEKREALQQWADHVERLVQ